MGQGEKIADESTVSAQSVHPSTSGVFRRAALQEGSWPPPPSPEQHAEAWSLCTKAYDVFAECVTRPFAEDAIRLVHVTSGTRVLDVAAGTGAFSLAAARRGAEVLATDFSPEMIAELQRKCGRLGHDNVRAELMDGQALSLPDNSFDVAASLFGLMFFPDHDRGLSELLRVLRPGGRALVATWAPPARVEMMRLVGDAAMSAKLELPAAEELPHWAALSSPRGLKHRLLALGFAKVHVVSVAHVWTFDRAEMLAELLPIATPSFSALFEAMDAVQREAFVQALVNDLRERQGDGPFAVTSEGFIAVGTKA